MRNPTVAERLRWSWTTRRRRPTTADVIAEMMSNQGRYLAIMTGRPPAPPPPDPTMCPCGHTYGRHTNRPRGYGCCDCLCLTVAA